MKRVVIPILLLAAGAALSACDGVAITPIEPAGSPATTMSPTLDGTPPTTGPSGGSTTNPSPGPSGDVPASAMLNEADLPGELKLVTSDAAGAGPIPEGWRGDPVWDYYLPYCDAYWGLNISGFDSRKAIRVNTYEGPGERRVFQTVERYADAAAAERVFQEARKVVTACGVGSNSTAYHHFSPLQAGDSSWSFQSLTESPTETKHSNWYVVRRGALITVVEAQAVSLGDPSPMIVQRLCTYTSC